MTLSALYAGRFIMCQFSGMLLNYGDQEAPRHVGGMFLGYKACFFSLTHCHVRNFYDICKIFADPMCLHD